MYIYIFTIYHKSPYIPYKGGRYPTEEEIARVLRYYEKNKDEIESEMTPMILKFRKGRVTYVVDKNDNLIKG